MALFKLPIFSWSLSISCKMFSLIKRSEIAIMFNEKRKRLNKNGKICLKALFLKGCELKVKKC